MGAVPTPTTPTTASGVGRVVIVGAGAAGLATADALRAEGHDGEIVLVGEEDATPYDRPPLSKQVLAGTWPPERVVLRSREDLDAAGVTFRGGRRAESLDCDARRVRLGDGSTEDYDALVIATGVRARRLPFGHDLADVLVLRTLDDTLALRARLDGGTRRVVVVGAGFLGAEAAAACRELGHDVALVDPATQPLLTVVGPEVGETVAELHREHGVALHLGHGVAALHGRADEPTRVGSVALNDGTELEADLVLVAIGAVPAVEWLAGSGVPLDAPGEGGGVRCDEQGRAAEAVWAVGDVAGWWDPVGGTHVRVEHRLTATEHGRAVARDVLGLPPRGTTPVSYFWSDQYDLKLQSYGRPSARLARQVVEGSLAERRFVVAYVDAQDLVVGVVGAGMVKAVRTWRQAVLEHRALADALVGA